MNKLYLRLVFAIAVAVCISSLDKTDLYAQKTPIPAGNNNTTEVQQHTQHTFDNLIISENIPLNGQLITGDYILLMDFTPFATSVEGHSHIAMKVPCNEEGSPKVTVVTGIAPTLNTLDVGNAIN